MSNEVSPREICAESTRYQIAIVITKIGTYHVFPTKLL
jgi:hypothetical protein